MGRNQAVFGLQQGVILPDRLGGDHVQPGGVHLAAVQRVGQILFHHQLATAVVDDDHAVLHFFNIGLVDDALSLREQGAVQGDHVGSMQQSVQIHIIPNFLPVLPDAAAVGNDLHAQGSGNAACSLADAAEADDAHGFALQLDQGGVPEAPVRVGRPAALMDGLAVVGHMVADLQQQRDGKLGHGGGAVGGHVADGDSLLRGGPAVDHVVARGQNGDESDVGAGLQHPFADGHLVDEHHLGVADPLYDLVLTAGPVIDRQFPKFPQAVPAQIAGVLGVSVKHDHFHNANLKSL